jgi:hypothetical protein
MCFANESTVSGGDVYRDGRHHTLPEGAEEVTLWQRYCSEIRLARGNDPRLEDFGGIMSRHGRDKARGDRASRSRAQCDREDKVPENRLRRVAQRRGYRLTKSRVRDKAAPGYGGYMLIAAFGNLVMLGADPYSFCATLDDVEDYLNQADAGDHPGAVHVPVRSH